MAVLQLSIIIPVCNVEKYIQPCLESIYRQGLDDSCFEIIIINDGSTDQTMEKVVELQRRHHHITIIEQGNLGPSVSRNAGMEKAKGDYILFIDSDDMLMDHALPVLLRLAATTSADMIVPDFQRMKDEDIAGPYDSQMKDDTVIEKSGVDYYVEAYRPDVGSFIWRILYKRAFLEANRLRFIPGVYYEDISFLQQCYLKAERVVGVHLVCYIYRIRPRSCTYSFTMKNAMDYNTAIASSWSLLSNEHLSERVRSRIYDNVFLFFNYEVDCIISVFREPAERNAIVRDLRQKVPGLRFKGSLRKSVVSWCFNTLPFTYIRWRMFSKKVNNWFLARFNAGSLISV